ncbi:hypothetical protein QUB11_18715, partial [Microcoleus sp. B6-A1]|uniref:hypothetical protein n=1 Tax=Microcoleus sp. B6-A1 TaxID=2818684 RepID=UPI002FD64833
LNNLQFYLFLWDGRPARPFWPGGTPIPQTCGSYLILIPKIQIQDLVNPPRLKTRNCRSINFC